MMIRISFTVFLCFIGVLFAFGQKKEIPNQNKWGYVDTNLILQKMPDYQKALEEVNLLSEAWSVELKDKYLTIDSLYKDFNEQSILLTAEEKQEKLKGLNAMEDSLSAYRNEIFGFEGLFFQKKKELLKTVQDRLFDAIEIVAEEYKLQTVFDKAQDENIIYVNPIHDYSDYVLEKLGLGDPNDKIR